MGNGHIGIILTVGFLRLYIAIKRKFILIHLFPSIRMLDLQDIDFTCVTLWQKPWRAAPLARTYNIYLRTFNSLK